MSKKFDLHVSVVLLSMYLTVVLEKKKLSCLRLNLNKSPPIFKNGDNYENNNELEVWQSFSSLKKTKL